MAKCPVRCVLAYAGSREVSDRVHALQMRYRKRNWPILDVEQNNDWPMRPNIL